MEIPGGGILGRLGERVLGWIALALLIGVGIAIWQTPPDTKAAIWSGIWRTIAWLLIVAALPWTARLFIGRVLEIGSNWAGALLIAAFLAADIIVALVLMSAWPESGWAWVACLAALGVAGTYNYLVTEYLAESSGL
jgi:hypothetical protein